MAAELPPHFKNLQLILPYCFRSSEDGEVLIGPSARGAKVCTVCVPCVRAHTHTRVHKVPPSDGFPQERTVKVDLCVVSNDTRAMPMVNCMNQTPAYHGAVTHSLDVVGFPSPQGTLYLDTITRCSQTIKEKWLKSFNKAPEEIVALATKPRPVVNTNDRVFKAQMAATADKRDPDSKDHASKVITIAPPPPHTHTHTHTLAVVQWTS